jgi:hypothetical protein
MLPLIATLTERGCVVLDQPQQVGKHWSLQQIQSLGVITLLRLIPLRGTQPRLYVGLVITKG